MDTHETKELLNEQYQENDSESEDSILQSMQDAKTPRCTGYRDRLILVRVLLDVLVLAGLALLVVLIVQREYPVSRPECVQHHLPVGSDLSGFVPSGTPMLCSDRQEPRSLTSTSPFRCQYISDVMGLWARRLHVVTSGFRQRVIV